MLDRFSSLVDVLRHHASVRADQTAFTYLGTGSQEQVTLTFQEVDTRARAIAVLLMQQCRPGDRALLIYPPGLDFLSAFFGCLYAGVIAVPAYPPRANLQGMERLRAIAADTAAPVTLTTSALASKLEVAWQQKVGAAPPRSVATDTLALELAATWKPPSIGREHLAFLQYTSGSTGTPKGVMVSHGNLLHNISIFARTCREDSSSIFMTWLPLFHDLGLIGNALMSIALGARSVLMPPVAFLQEPALWLRAISQYKATTSGGPNFAYALCVEKCRPEELEGLDLRSWRIALNAAEPIHAEDMERFYEKFKPFGFRREAFYPGYGMAEATLFLTSGIPETPPVILHASESALLEGRGQPALPGENSRAVVGCGRAPPETELVIADPESGAPLPECHVGEIQVAGESVAQGYWNKPELTGEIFRYRPTGSSRGPYLRTGDLGFLRGGEVFITGRLKDLIIIRGRNHYPQDIEQTVQASHPGLQPHGGAAFSVEVSGEEKVVVVQEVKRRALRELDVDAIARAVREALAEHHELELHTLVLIKPGHTLKTTSGKIRRRDSRKAFLESQLPEVGRWEADPPEQASPPSAQPKPNAAPEAPGRVARWLRERIAERVHRAVHEVELDAPLARYGLDSLGAAQLTGELSTWLGRSIDPTALYDYPTIQALSDSLEGVGPALPAPRATPRPSGRLAIVGLSCRFPGAPDRDAFWKLLCDGVDAISEPPASRGESTRRTATLGTQVPRWGGFLERVDTFDAGFFNISDREARSMDPQQRLLLEVAWEALEDAGLAPDALAGSQTGVFIGISSSDYAWLRMARPAGSPDVYLGTGSALSIAANRLSYVLDLRGPSLAIDTACSSSLVALHTAAQSLLRGECQLALVGGVNVLLAPELTAAFAQAGMLAPDGRCKTFDARANGYVRGEGAGVVVLKPLEQAERDGDRIWAVVRGSAVNQDGRTNGLTAPNGPAQEAVIQEALRTAGVEAQAIDYVEAHGTGTDLGDTIELHALGNALGTARAPKQPLWVGAVKTNIGHLEAAAGIAGVIKTTLALHHQHIPPNLHFEKLNPRIALGDKPLRVPTRAEPWPSSPGKTRLAGVSAFGFGGTNVHAILEEAPPAPAREVERERPWHILPLSARREADLPRLARRYLSHLDENPGVPLAELCASASLGRAHLRHRAALTLDSEASLRSQLRALAETSASPRGARPGAPAAPVKTVFLFTGQGSQYPGMGAALYTSAPVFRQAIDRCDAVLRPLLGTSIVELLRAGTSDELRDTARLQPVLFSLEYALAELWQSWSIVPDAVMGHSLGEYVAACVAGVLTVEDALRLVFERGRLLGSLPPGGMMASVLLTEERLRELCPGFGDEGLAIAAFNGPEHLVLSGQAAALQRLLEVLARQQIRTQPLEVSQAFHSPLVAPIAEEFRRVAEGFRHQPPRVRWISNVSGAPMEAGEVGAAYWTRQLLAPVRFTQGIEALLRDGATHFLELGPHPVLTGMGRRCPGAEQAVWLDSLARGRSDWAGLTRSLARLYVAGLPIRWDEFEKGCFRARVPLPTYPFDRKSYWLDERDMSPPSATPAQSQDKVVTALSAAPTHVKPEEVLSSLRQTIASLMELAPEDVDIQAPFLEMGADSMVMLDAVRAIEERYGVSIAVRQLFTELINIELLARYIADNTKVALAPPSQPAPTAPPAQAAPPLPAPPAGAPVLPVVMAPASGSTLERIVAQQLQAMNQLMERQLTAVQQTGAFMHPAVTAPAVEPPAAAPSAAPKAPPAQPAEERESIPSPTAMFSFDTEDKSRHLTPRQQQHLQQLIERCTRKMPSSKQHTQKYRKVLADNRASAGFRFTTKEMLFPVVAERSQGSAFWDVDGNRFLDISMGFGVNLFGHNPPFVIQALREQLDIGIQQGPQSNLAGEVAALLTELTGVERAAFCNSGTEAVMTALRLARTVTGRTKVALFAGAYHGHFDGVLAVPSQGGRSPLPVPTAPGTPQNQVADLLILDYGNPESLALIEQHGAELAAVLVEPVQSRRPHLQPREFLQELRQLTRRIGAALIFDEVITGFRIHPGGAQAHFGIRADLVTYGKIVGGGMPIGVVAGQSAFLDGLDGGLWRYGDASYPYAKTTFFAGTFCKHPLAMVAARACLQQVKAQGPQLQEDLNRRTQALAEELNRFFERERFPIKVVHFGSLFRFAFKGNLDLFFYHLLEKGVYIWEGRNCFLSTAHTEEDIALLVRAVQESARELREGGFLPEDSGPQPPSPPQKPRAEEPSRHTSGALASPEAIAEGLGPSVRARAATPELAGYAQGLAALDTLCAAQAAQALQRLGWSPIPGQRFASEALARELRITGGRRRLFERLLSILEEEKILGRRGDMLEILAVPAFPSPAARAEALGVEFPSVKHELALLSRCGERLADVLRGSCDATEILFPRGDTHLVAEVYRSSPVARAMNALVAEAVASAVANLPPGRRPRLLELGAGTGSTTAEIFARLPGADWEYTFTDVSSFFLSRAREQFRAHAPVHYRTLDIQKDPTSQGFPEQGFDIVIAANVLHATPDVKQSVEHARRLLAPGGLLVLLELTRAQRFLDLTFGLTDGWWSFSDTGLRRAHPLLSAEQWRELLEGSGFRRGLVLPEDRSSLLSGQGLLLADRAIDLPLTESQRQMWALAQLGPSGLLANNYTVALQLEGPLEHALLQQALEEVVRRHEALRTVLRPHAQGQRILPTLSIPVLQLDLSAAEPAERERAVQRWFEEENQRPFDFERGPFLRLTVLRLAPELHLLAASTHHILVDGVSMAIVLQELAALYSAARKGEPARLPPVLQFRDFIAQLPPAPTAGEGTQAHALLPILELPTDRPYPARPTYRAARQTLVLEGSLPRQLKQFSQRRGYTSFMVLTAAYTALLHRLSGQDELVVAMPLAGRAINGSEGTVGYAAQSFPLRSRLEEARTVQAHLDATREALLRAMEDDGQAGALALQAGERRGGRNPLNTAAINLDRSQQVPRFHGLKVQLVSPPIHFAAVELRLNITELTERFVLDLDYQGDLFDEPTARRFLLHYRTLLEGMLAELSCPLIRLPLLDAEARQQLLQDWNQTSTDLPEPALIHAVFSRVAARTPEAPALVTGDRAVTYQQLELQSNQLAHHLRELGVGPEVRVAVCMERSIELIVALLGILKAGGTYVPLDPAYPYDRIAFMLQDCGAPILLSQERLDSQLPSHLGQTLFFEQEQQALQARSGEALDSGVAPGDAAYIIYTSGSTGRPKGVVVPHRGLCNLALAQSRLFGVRPESRVLEFASFSFDASISEVFMALSAGAALYLAGKEELRPGPDLLGSLRRHRITHITLPPSALAAMSPEGLPELSSLIVAGEELPPELAARWAEGRRLFNAYGPTETSVCATLWEWREGYRRPPIGRPIDNVQLYVLDRHQQPVPTGVPGELYIGGVGVAREYLHRPELTAEKFIPSPFVRDGARGEVPRLYRSGDLVRYLPDGNLEFLGRIDHQEKIRGFRVEPGEIQAALAQHPEVRECAVIVRADASGTKRLVAYAVPSADALPTTEALREFLARTLPEYMLPSAFVPLAALPLTPNGKVDRAALPEPGTERPSLETRFEEPRTPAEAQLAAIWMQVLSLSKVGIHDNFFSLGGDSISAIQVIARANEAGLALTIDQLLSHHQTIASLAASVGTSTPRTADEGPVTGPVPLTPIQQWFFAQELPAPHFYNQSLLLRLREGTSLELLEQALNQLLEHHDMLRARASRGNVGWSQHIAPPGERLSLRVLPIEPGADAAVAPRRIIEEVERSLHLEHGPLFKATLLRTPSGELLLLTAHHLVVDGVSWRILLEDLATSYQRLQTGEPAYLPPRTTSYREWAEALMAQASTPKVHAELPLWVELAGHAVPALPVDFDRGDNTAGSTKTVMTRLPAAETAELMTKVPATLHVRINDALLTALAEAVGRWTGTSHVRLDLEGHGRDSLQGKVDLSRTVGWFTALYPVVLERAPGGQVKETLKAVKERLRSIPSQGLHFGSLRYLNGAPEVAKALARLPSAQLAFNYLGQFEMSTAGGPFEPSLEAPERQQDPRGLRLHLLELNGWVTDGVLTLQWTYSENHHERSTIERLANDYLAALRSLIELCRQPEAQASFTPSDFPRARLKQGELDKLLSRLDRSSKRKTS